MRRVLFVGRMRYRLPLSESLARKWDALSERLDVRVLAAGMERPEDGDPRFDLKPPLHPGVLDGPAFFGSLPLRVASELRRFRPDVVVAQSPYEALAVLAGRGLARSDAALVVEIHGDWHTFARLYGSRARGLLAPVTDVIAPWAVRRAEAVRTLSPFTTELVREAGAEPAAIFTTYTDLSAFTELPVQPLPDRPSVVSVGVLQRYKNLDGIVAAWRLAAPRVPGAALHLVGDGPLRPLVEELLAGLPTQTSWSPALPVPDVVAAMDESWGLLLPSRSEGTPRVSLEALCRGRAVIGGRAGGIPDVVRDGENGLLVDPEDVEGIADALVRLLSDRELAVRLGAAAGADAQRWTYTADEYADRIVELVERAIAAR